MSPLIWQQIWRVVILFYGGVTVGIVHQAVRAGQRRWKPGPLLAFLQDLLFWTLAALLTCAFLYYGAYGNLTVHGTVAYCGGLALWQIVFGEKFLGLFSQIYVIIKQIIVSKGERKYGTKEKKQGFRRRRGFRY